MTNLYVFIHTKDLPKENADKMTQKQGNEFYIFIFKKLFLPLQFNQF